MSIFRKFLFVAGCGLLAVAAGCHSARFSAFDMIRKPAPGLSEMPAVATLTARRAQGHPKGTRTRLPEMEVVPADLPDEAVQPAGLLEPSLTPATTGLTLEALEQIALQHNPAIQQAAASASKATGIRYQVGRYPNPTVGYQGAQLADRGTDQHTAFIAQDIVLGDKLHLNARVLDQEVQSQLWEVETQRYRVLTDVRRKFYEALAAQERRRLAGEFYDVAEEGVRIAKIRQDALEGSLPEVLQAEIQLNGVDLLRQRADFAYQAAWTELLALAGVPDLATTELAGTLHVTAAHRDWETTYQQLAAVSPEVQAASSRVARAQMNLQRQHAQPIPNLQTMFAAGYDQGTNSDLINLQVGVPLPLFNANHGNISAAHAEYCRAGQEMCRLQLALKQRLARAAQQYDSAAVMVSRYESTILPKAQQTLDLSEQAYAIGEFSFLQVLVARRTFFESNLEYVQALSELAQSKSLVDGMLLTGGLDGTPDTTLDDGLRGQALSQE